MKQILAILFVSIVLIGCEKRRIPTVPIRPDQQADKLLLMRLHNAERSSSYPLEMDSRLAAKAQEHAEWMAYKRKLKHSDLRVEGNWRTVGENIAMGQRNEHQVVDGWMNSRGHRANILNKRFTHVGFGYVVSEEGYPYWCSIFGG